MKENLLYALEHACRINPVRMWEFGAVVDKRNPEMKSRFVASLYEDLVSIGAEREARSVLSENLGIEEVKPFTPEQRALYRE